jgi:hypothetical protein
MCYCACVERVHECMWEGVQVSALGVGVHAHNITKI